MPFQLALSTVVLEKRERGGDIPQGSPHRFFASKAFRPCVLGWAALAIAVLLWGYGYKLSLYHQDKHSSQIPVAKLWIEHRDSVVSAASELHAQTIIPTISVPALASIPQNLLQEERPISRLAIRYAGIAALGSLIPLRSPPPSPLLLT